MRFFLFAREAEIVPLCGTRMNPHFLFLLRKRKRSFTVKRKDALAARNFPAGKIWPKDGGRANCVWKTLPGIIRLRCALASISAFMPQIDTWVQTLLEVPDRFSFSFRCRSAGGPQGGKSRGEGPLLSVSVQGVVRRGKSKSPSVVSL